MFFLVDRCAVDDADDFIDRIGELQPAIFDVHAGMRMRKIAAVRHRRCGPTGARVGQPRS